MEWGELVQGLFKDYPFLTVIGPLVGIILAWVKENGKLGGWALLGAAVVVSAGVIAAYGYAAGWTTAEWHKAPFATIVTVAISNLTSNTALHAKEALTKGNQSG